MNLKIFTNNIEEKAVSQIYQLLEQPAFKDAKIRIMPDVHAGAGCVIGFTANLGDKVIPNIVGVDIGCLDCESEVLTQNGWIKISNYNDEKILVYDKHKDEAFFELPYAYISQPCSKFYHFVNSKGLDQMLSKEHRMLVFKGYKKKGFENIVLSPEELNNLSLEKGYYNFKTSFNIKNKGLDLTENQIRILVMVQADGTLRKNNRIELHFKKERKIKRAEQLLENEKIKFNKNFGSDGSVFINFVSEKLYSKDLTAFYLASFEQLKVLTDEILKWDGHEGYRSYYASTNKKNADVVQFAFSATNVRASIYSSSSKNENFSTVYDVIKTQNSYVNYNVKGKIVSSTDGKKYCFTTSTGFFVARRNNNIFITGNCGMHVVKLGNPDIDLEALDKFIHDNIPAGFCVNSKIQKEFDLKKLYCFSELENTNRLALGIGSLGGGNHFIELDVDEKGCKYLVIHTGSRNLGKQVACLYQNKAIVYCRDRHKPIIESKIQELKAQGRQAEIADTIAKINEEYKQYSVPKELCYLEGELREQYLHDMKLCQEYAVYNREVIATKIKDFLKITKPEDEWECIHNYIDNNNMVRKGAIAAHKGQKVIIPLNMRDGSILGLGKGNTDWNESGPHGAGRLLSRGEAKRTLSVDDFKKSMNGIFTTTVNESTLDESPMVYKPAEEIINAIDDTIEITSIIRPIYNFKAGEE